VGAILPAAGVIPVRSLEPLGPTQVYLVWRGAEGVFLPGFHSFPGGVCEAGEPARRAAIRELFEETGVLLVRGTLPEARLLEERRRGLLAGQISSDQAFEGLILDVEGLLPSGVWVTPPYSRYRFRAQFFLAALPPHQEPAPWPPELQGGGWWTVPEALGAWERGDIALAPPTLEALQALHREPPRRAAALLQERLPDEEQKDMLLSPGMRYLPQRVVGPEGYVHTLLLGGTERLLLDPGSADPEELAWLEKAIRHAEQEGRPVREVVLTHHHPDHVSGAPRLRSLGLPLAAHAETAARLDFPVDRLVEDGDLWELGPDPAGHPWTLVALHTPGHAPGHLCLWEPRRRLLLAGDMVSGQGTVVIPAEPGCMRQYLDSLARLRALQPRLVMPAHGPPAGPGADILGACLAHRRQRELKVAAALAPEPVGLEDLLVRVYDDVAPALRGLARQSLLAHLYKLEEEGRACQVGEAWAAPRGSGPQTSRSST
jgi:glyoxylase-like metal-dependent hydrolase (beta-lactamase superfamily II)/8-oxo-dGTP pyrophosphatase MutT (NUDIX family)